MRTEEVVQRVQSLYSKGVQSDDSRLTSRHIYNKLITIRSRLISQKANKKQKISQWNYQTLPCVKLEKVPAHECPCLPPVGCSILRTTVPLPKTLVNLNKHMIQSVTSVEGSIIYSETSWKEKKYKKYNRYTSDKPDYFIHNDYLWITHKGASKIATVVAVFDDPAEAEAFPSYCDGDTPTQDCQSPLDKEFPMDNGMIDTLIDMAVQELVTYFNQSIEDLTNDSQDNVTQRQQYRRPTQSRNQQYVDPNEKSKR